MYSNGCRFEGGMKHFFQRILRGTFFKRYFVALLKVHYLYQNRAPQRCYWNLNVQDLKTIYENAMPECVSIVGDSKTIETSLHSLMSLQLSPSLVMVQPSAHSHVNDPSVFRHRPLRHRSSKIWHSLISAQTTSMYAK